MNAYAHQIELSRTERIEAVFTGKCAFTFRIHGSGTHRHFIFCTQIDSYVRLVRGCKKNIFHFVEVWSVSLANWVISSFTEFISGFHELQWYKRSYQNPSKCYFQSEVTKSLVPFGVEWVNLKGVKQSLLRYIVLLTYDFTTYCTLKVIVLCCSGKEELGSNHESFLRHRHGLRVRECHRWGASSPRASASVHGK